MACQRTCQGGVCIRFARIFQLFRHLINDPRSGLLEMIKSTFAPRASSKPRQPVRATENGGFLISGALISTVDSKTITLASGDSFQFQDKSYEWETPGNETAVVIWVGAPPVY
jgi:hypothetical protein